MKKQLIRLTEQDLHKIVKESVENILKENNLALLKKKKALNRKKNKPQEQNHKHSAFVPNNTKYSYEELGLMDDPDYLGL